MKVAKDFAPRVKAIAESTPREVIGNLLRTMLPREPVRVREPRPVGFAPAPSPLGRDPLAPLKKVRTRVPRGRWEPITLIVEPRFSGLKRGSGRYAKLAYLWDNDVKSTSECLGIDVVDDKGKLHTIDMGALRGMAERGHIKLG